MRLDPLPEHVAVLRALRGLGDLLLLVPTLRSLRAALPRARVTFIGLPEARWVAERFPHYVDDFMEFPGWPGVPEREVDFDRLVRFLADARECRFDLVLQLQGSGLYTNPFVSLLAAQRSARYCLPGQFRPDPDGFLPQPVRVPEALRYLRVPEHLGLPVGLRGRVSAHRRRSPFGTGDPGRGRRRAGLLRLPPSRGEPALALLVGGRARRRRRRARRAGARRRPHRERRRGRPHGGGGGAHGHDGHRPRRKDARPRRPRGARRRRPLLVAPDTGVAHLAVALGVPTIVVFRWSDPHRWAPDPRRYRALGWADPNAVDSGPPLEARCLRDGCRVPWRDAADVPPASVTAADALAAAAELLAPEAEPREPARTSDDGGRPRGALRLRLE